MKSQHRAIPGSPPRRRIGLTALVAAAALALAGCAGSDPADPAGEGEEGGTLTIGLTQDVGKFDPIFSNLPTYNTFAYATPLFQTADGEFGGYLAESWELAPDSKALSFTLRDDAKFSDGTAVTADAAVASMTRFLTTPSAKLPQYGAQIAGVSATDEFTVEIAFKIAVPQSYAFALVNQDSAFAMITSEAGAADPDALNTETMGAGPYVLDQAKSVSGTEYTFVPNEHYFAPETRTYDEIVIKPFSDPSALANALTSGQVTYAVSLLAPLAQQAETAGMQLSTGALGIGDSGTAMLVFGNRTTGPLADVRVRQAIAHAIPRDDLNTSLQAGMATATSSATPAGVGGHTGEDPFPYDVDAAKALLADAGYPDGFELTITSPSAADPGNLIGLALQSALGEIGVAVTLDRNDDPFTALMGKILGGGGFEAYVYTEPGESVFTLVTSSMTGVAPLNPNAEEIPASVSDAIAAVAAAPAEEQDEALADVTRAVDELQWSTTLLSIPRLTVVQPGVTGVPASYVTAEPAPYSPNEGESWSGN
ncbi:MULTISPECIES: ABC transporter substrate-binding protein [unclassified Microbacterium]|uniref:ABC transporter substrate-binding protein n=1 Tax=unclassified Microbacterium TaxID=2609290 RepID=UPI00214BE355|nr:MULTISPECIES: ABC transporter substrate-binding protein [unclassified Microbacterium]MCR2783273.1 ABC transporter substrate-binding protein [Microbacterium sp. zg.B96]WIM15852.1 ABC transporter substrate-binding protein [Microbacterium sp. zg-B96]